MTSIKIGKKYAYFVVLILILVILFGLLQLTLGSKKITQNRIAILETNEGNITIQLFEDIAPQATARFIKLSNNDFYSGTIIHRVFPSLAIYGGQYTMDSVLKEFSEDPIPVEINPDVTHIPGTISYLRTSLNDMAVGCQFIICLENISSLDGRNSAFGIVIEGLELLEKISNYPHDDQYKDGSGRLLHPFDVVIDKITILTPE